MACRGLFHRGGYQGIGKAIEAHTELPERRTEGNGTEPPAPDGQAQKQSREAVKMGIPSISHFKAP